MSLEMSKGGGGVKQRVSGQMPPDTFPPGHMLPGQMPPRTNAPLGQTPPRTSAPPSGKVGRHI